MEEFPPSCGKVPAHPWRDSTAGESMPQIDQSGSTLAMALLQAVAPDYRAFCVLFSIGSVKYGTNPVQDESGNPVFDTESVLQVENPKDSLVLVATEKKEKEFYGQLIIPLSDLETCRNGQVFQKKLEPHKKCSKPTGEIHFEAWISKVLTSSSIVPGDTLVANGLPEREKKAKGLKKSLANLIGGTPKLPRKLIIKKDSRGGSFKNSREFSSCLDLPAGRSVTLPGTSGSSLTLNNMKIPEVRVIKEDEDEKEEEEEESKAPLVTGISPNSGPASGGTRITIRGDNLGVSRQDVVGLFVCGSNVLSSLEYFGPSKVACTTKPWRPGEGTITVETQSGGKSISSIKFNFVGGGEATEVRRSDSLKEAPGRSPRASDFGSPQLTRAGPEERGLFKKGGLGVPGLAPSRSMLDLTSRDGRSSGESLPTSSSSHQFFTNSGEKKPVVSIHPFKIPEPPSKTSKILNRISSGHDHKMLKDVQVELDSYQTVNSELRTKAYELQDENKRLREYIEGLLTKIMVQCPDMLCNDQK